ncbi:hypothetical protein GWI33_019698 [Rhynchophorus ferrugineus]|uniref:Uncharacterized protein n=1 Tax=Rhynchophorus ferrugineus TaxID=354439 RepID=A0A834HXT2_RHYFE|nr:hypothetical protein GWI33_019698 [Rhynchophorus ferrugineus]
MASRSYRPGRRNVVVNGKTSKMQFPENVICLGRSLFLVRCLPRLLERAGEHAGPNSTKSNPGGTGRDVIAKPPEEASVTQVGVHFSPSAGHQTEDRDRRALLRNPPLALAGPCNAFPCRAMGRAHHLDRRTDPIRVPFGVRFPYALAHVQGDLCTSRWTRAPGAAASKVARKKIDYLTRIPIFCAQSWYRF